MTTFLDAYRRATAMLYKVVWIPEDLPMDDPRWMTSYVVARSFDEAASRLSTNPHDIKSIVVLGAVIERQTIEILDTKAPS